jgi:hypothetical protein
MSMVYTILLAPNEHTFIPYSMVAAYILYLKLAISNCTQILVNEKLDSIPN